MRIPLAVTGAVLLLCGSAALAAGLGAFDALGALSGRPPLDPSLVRYARDEGWFLPVAAGTAEAAALAGQLWLVLQGRALIQRRRPDVDPRVRALAHVASGELAVAAREMPGVQDARVRLTGSAHRPRLRMRVDCARDALVGEVYGELGAGPVERYRRAVGMPDLPVVIRFRTAAARRGRRRRPRPGPA
ncbi:hypothetical protein ACFOY4_27090 [Actinomadura syzygii]|uniref:Alkaline shock response membrane anchor protein AmaP n=1 Tax=Actinomadura syzygii TaxID=1427538 RepID=A0A5D0UI83_9ACTN|nr:hypothetical protein [Actinomadura syzygii]TYC17305.1 hypothetical protein FXF65_04605 [Actinomadura syzygii]